MKLPDWGIKLFIKLGWIKVTPYNPSLVNPNSLDLRLGNRFGNIEAALAIGIIDPLIPETFKTWSEERESYVLEPKGTVISCLLEDITLHRFVCSEIRGKSSLGRLFLDNSSVAGWVDAGWSGVLTIELINNSDRSIRLTPGMKIGQMVFNLTLPCFKHYGERVTSKYQRQSPGQGSKGI